MHLHKPFPIFLPLHYTLSTLLLLSNLFVIFPISSQNRLLIVRVFAFNSVCLFLLLNSESDFLCFLPPFSPSTKQDKNYTANNFCDFSWFGALRFSQLRTQFRRLNSSILRAKRQNAEMGTSMTSKEAKERVGERILALQQLVSPYGKTDTASVLSEAIEYVRFLHEQVKVLSAPYLLCGPVTKTDNVAEQHSLRNRGLCLVPISSTVGLARSNGADIWAPVQSSSPRF